jgi:hypothetical protein
MVTKRAKQDKGQEAEALKAKRELFCRYYTQNQELFGNATLSYAEAFDYKLDELSREGVYEEIESEDGTIEQGKLLEPSEYDKAYHTCSVLSSRLLRNADIQARITALLNELLKDNIVDSQLAKLITQDSDNTAKIAGIREYNKLRGRIIDKTQNVDRLPFGETDLSAVIAALPQERQDYYYGVIRELVAEAELSRSAGSGQSGGTGQA